MFAPQKYGNWSIISRGGCRRKRVDGCLGVHFVNRGTKELPDWLPMTGERPERTPCGGGAFPLVSAERSHSVLKLSSGCKARPSWM